MACAQLKQLSRGKEEEKGMRGKHERERKNPSCVSWSHYSNRSAEEKLGASNQTRTENILFSLKKNK